MRKKQPGIQPVIIAGNALATTWWGKSWNSNLERYADYSNRIGRGRSYVRNRAVLDLQLVHLPIIWHDCQVMLPMSPLPGYASSLRRRVTDERAYGRLTASTPTHA